MIGDPIIEKSYNFTEILSKVVTESNKTLHSAIFYTFS